MWSKATIPALALALLPAVISHPAQGNIFIRQIAEPAAQLTVVDQSVQQPTRVPKVVIYVDKEGNQIRTATEAILIVPTTPVILASPPQSSDAPAKPTPTTAKELGAPSEIKKPTLPPTTPHPAEAAASSSSSSDNSDNSDNSNNKESDPPPPNVAVAAAASAAEMSGIAYAPYNKDGSCRKAHQVDADFKHFAGKYSLVRLYGTDCGQIPLVYRAAKRANIGLFLGLFELGRLEEQVASVVTGVGKDWGPVRAISVGNELVNSRQAGPQQVLAAVAKAKQLLAAAGYKGPVTTVDTFVAAREHMELCDQVDICAINVHPFFDGNTTPERAGSFVRAVVDDIRSKLKDPKKRVVVTETGWPWQGTTNRLATPGLSQQSVAIKSIQSAFADRPADLILFSAFNDLWKHEDAATFFAEKSWGIGGLSADADK